MKKIKTLLFVIFLIFLIIWFIQTSRKEMEDFYYAQMINSIERRNIVIPATKDIPKPEINAEAVISVRINTAGQEKIIFQKEMYRGLPIASITKLMSAIIVLDNQEEYNLNRTINISEEAASQLDSHYIGSLKANEKKTIKELLELILIYSSNDSAFALSEILGKEVFVQKMNEKAKEIGLINTRFINSTGLDPKNGNIPNYSTVRDLAKMTQYILQNYPYILEISSENQNHDTNYGLKDLLLNSNQQLIGGKTGYTFNAGGCLLTILKNEKNQIFINIILGTISPEKRVEEMQKIINWINLQ